MAQTISFGGAGTIGGSTSFTPTPVKGLANTNYLSGGASGTDYNFTKQYLPDLYEKEFERYGNRSISSFLRMVGAEMPCTSDLIKWSEQGRLHVRATGQINGTNSIHSGSGLSGMDNHNFRVNQTIVVINDETARLGNELKCLITAVSTNAITVEPYSQAELTTAGFSNGDDVTLFVYGSEFKKGTDGMAESLEAGFESFDNNPIIIKDKYEVSGSEMAHIGWVEVTTENGATGYMWYLKSEHETRLRFEDYLETAMVEGEPAVSGSGAADESMKGTKGLFFEVTNRGNTSTGSITDRSDMEAVAKVLDKEGAIQENVLFVNRQTSFDIDSFLANLTAGDATQHASSYGIFDNDMDMALNLGFSGFRLGYDFYKSDWKYLNDATLRGATNNAIDGILVPAGTTTVYDQVLGENAKRPFLHVRYRQSAMEDRKYKSWVVGSAGGAMTTGKDTMEVHFLSERALCVMGANNFILFK